MPTPPKIFVSYSHDSPAHAKRVLDLANALLGNGIDVILDQYNPVPSEGWPRWMDRNLDAADFVLMVCTPIYLQRVLGKTPPGVGLGVQWEGNLIYNRIYNKPLAGDKYLPILLDGADSANIPTPVQGHTFFRLTQFDLADANYLALYRHLTGQPAIVKPPIGPVTTLLPNP